MNKKGAIELSANFLVVIIISGVIVVGGLGVFFKMKANTQNYVDAVDSQTNDRLKSIMLSNNYRVAAYPQDPTITNGNSQLIGVGITNIYDEQRNFTINVSVKRYVGTTGTPITASLSDYYVMLNKNVSVAPHDQIVKNLLVKMPKYADKAQYVYTINVTSKNSTDAVTSLGLVQVYVDNT